MKPKKITVRLKPGAGELHLSAGDTLYSSLVSRIPHFPGTCQGRGLCGLCRVKVLPPPPPTESDRRLIPVPLINEGWRLACRHMLHSSAEITLQEYREAPATISGVFALQKGDPLLKALPGKNGKVSVKSGRTVLDILEKGGRPTLLAAGLDLGTTTISLQLVDLSRPAVLGTAVTGNPQSRYGDDIISRIFMASRPDGLQQLKALAYQSVNMLLDVLKERAGLQGSPIYALIMAGNPAMTAIFSGINPSSLASPPFHSPPIPSGLEGARQNGLHLHPNAVVKIMPGMGSFVGGDITSGLVNSGITPGDRRTTFYIDLGTNGELVLKAGPRYIVTSTAAGPALEGWKISCGMRADEGAVDSVRLEADVSITVIGDRPPRGICGSGLLDLLHGLVKAGLVNQDGRLISRDDAALHPRRHLADRLAERQGQPAFVIAGRSDGDIFITQSDIRELQLARSAIRTGIQFLLEEAGADAEDVERVVVAGTFGFHLSDDCLTGGGFLPAAWKGRIKFAGNASLSGIRECLLSRKNLLKASAISQRADVIHLAVNDRFQKTFIENLRFDT